jgi:hypothetical protein
MQSIYTPGRASAASFFLLLILLIAFLGSEAPSALASLSTIGLPFALFSTLYFAGRWIAAVRASRQPQRVYAAGSTVPFDPAARRGWTTSAQEHAAKIEKTVTALSTEELIAVRVHPDSSPEMRDRVARELVSRGIGSDEVDDWMPPAERLYVPSALNASSPLSAYLTTVRNRTMLMDAGRLLLIAAIAYGVIFSILTSPSRPTGFYIPAPVWLLSIFVALAFHDWTRRNTGMIVLALAVSAMVLIRLRVLSSPGGGTFLIAGYALLVVASVVSGGKRARILLLRPFGKATMSSALKRVARRYIGPFGSVFTLSDRNYQPSITLDLLKLFGQLRHFVAPLLRPSLRIASVWSDASYRILASTLAGNAVLDFKSVYSGGQAFNIASANNWWKNCIDLLLHSTDIVVMDISRVQEGSTWEIIRLFRRDALDRTIFIAHADYSEHARQALAKHLPSGASPQILLYTENGQFSQGDDFEHAMEQALSKSLAQAHPGASATIR